MLLGPLREFYGRRIIYIISFTFYLIWLIPCAVAQNIQTMLIARFFDGVAGSAFLSVAGGTVGDMFNRNQLQAPMMIFTASPFIGPPIGKYLLLKERPFFTAKHGRSAGRGLYQPIHLLAMVLLRASDLGRRDAGADRPVPSGNVSSRPLAAQGHPFEKRDGR